jgi:hypothetical protein
VEKKGKLLLALLVLAGSTAVQGCADVPEAGENKAFAEISAGHRSRVESKMLRVIDNRSDFESIYYADATVSEKPLSIDFDQSLVIGAFMGMQTTGGHGIAIDSVATHSDHVEVAVRSIIPGADCITTQAITYPYHLVRIAKPGKPILFKETLEIRRCGN